MTRGAITLIDPFSTTYRIIPEPPVGHPADIGPAQPNIREQPIIHLGQLPTLFRQLIPAYDGVADTLEDAADILPEAICRALYTWGGASFQDHVLSPFYGLCSV